MPKNTPTSVHTQDGVAGKIAFASAARRTALAFGLALVLAVTSFAPLSVSASQAHALAPASPHASQLADGPNLWGCGGTPLPC